MVEDTEKKEYTKHVRRDLSFRGKYVVEAEIGHSNGILDMNYYVYRLLYARVVHVSSVRAVFCVANV